MVTMQSQEGLPERPTVFQFAAPNFDVEEIVYQRYDDADLLSVEREISPMRALEGANPRTLALSWRPAQTPVRSP